MLRETHTVRVSHLLVISALIIVSLASAGFRIAGFFADRITLVEYAVDDASVGCIVDRSTLVLVRAWWSTRLSECGERRFRLPALCEYTRGNWLGFGIWSFEIQLWLLFVLSAAYPTVVLIRGPLARYRRSRLQARFQRYPRTQRFLRWTGTVACMAILVLWFISGTHGVGYRSSAGWAAFLDGGLLVIHWKAPVQGRIKHAVSLTHQREWRDTKNPTVRRRLFANWMNEDDDRLVFSRAYPERFALATRPRFVWGGRGASVGLQGIVWPLWLVFVLAAAPTGLLWWSAIRRRYPVKCCQRCGYNLTGNVSGRCPECGAATAPEVGRTEELGPKRVGRRRAAAIASMAFLGAVIGGYGHWVIRANSGLAGKERAEPQDAAQVDETGNARTVASLIEDLKSPDWPTVRQAALSLEDRSRVAILPLISLLDSDERIDLENTGDLIYPGATLTSGHGRFLDYDIDCLNVRAAWVLEAITFENFGFREEEIREHPLLLAAEEKEGGASAAASMPHWPVGDPTTRAQIFAKAAARARAWWSRSSATWNRFTAILKALRSDDSLRQNEALEWLLGYRPSRSASVNKLSFDVLLRPEVEKLLKSPNRQIRLRAGTLLDGLGLRRFCERCGYDLIGIYRDSCPRCAVKIPP